MSEPNQRPASGYDTFYERFDLPSMQRLRLEAYGKEDVSQHSWVTRDELAEDISRLGLSRMSRLLDLGCGPGGPLTFVVSQVGCHAVGIDLSAPAIDSARVRATDLGLSTLIELEVADLNEPMPFQSGSFNAVMAVDVIRHLHNRAATFSEVARVLVPGGKFLFTDAGVLTGPISTDEVRRRSMHGFTQFAPAGFNERAIERAGFRLLESIDRTESVLLIARGRLAARIAHRAELVPAEGEAYFEAQLQYLETVVALSERGILSRRMYLVESDEAL